jgi:hypothetical protein
MQAYTAAQRALLDAPDHRLKMCLEIDDTTPLRYCTGNDAVEVDSTWYDPMPTMSFDKIALTNPRSAKTAVVLDDSQSGKAGAIKTQWYTSKLDADATVTWLLRESDGTWTSVLEIEWHVDSCSFNDRGAFTVTLSAAAGTRPRAGGGIGTRSEFPYAPEPGEAMRLGNHGITFRPGVGVPPPPPGGQQRIHVPHNRQNLVPGVLLPVDDTPTDPPTPVSGGNTSANS